MAYDEDFPHGVRAQLADVDAITEKLLPVDPGEPIVGEIALIVTPA